MISCEKEGKIWESGTFFVFLTDYWQMNQVVKSELKYFLCHGSGNRFVLFDSLEAPDVWNEIDLHALSREASARFQSDGILLLCHNEFGYGMRMFNTDGSEAEMCGNGIRCVARLAYERYLSQPCFTLWSGQNTYPITREQPLFEGLPTYGVEIAIGLQSVDFPRGGSRFLHEVIETLDPSLRFSFLHLGNPHIVAIVSEIDYALLERLGEKVKQLPAWFPQGVNVSLICPQGPQQLFVATYERGVGLTHSCGTAMTASTTAATLLGITSPDQEIEVFNRGGKVRCRCHIEEGKITTRLVGNATFEEEGLLRWEANRLELLSRSLRSDEIAGYAHFLAHLGLEKSPTKVY